MTPATCSELAVGTRVFLATDPVCAEGTVASVDGNRFLVTWDRGRTWVYAASQLVRVSA